MASNLKSTNVIEEEIKGHPDFNSLSEGELAIQTIAMPKDANANGDIFGGWILSQMDLAASIIAIKRAKSRCVTVALDGIVFHQPVFIGNVISCYTKLLKVGRTSMTIQVTVYRTNFEEEVVKVTEGIFTYVAIDEQRLPQKVDRLS